MIYDATFGFKASNVAVPPPNSVLSSPSVLWVSVGSADHVNSEVGHLLLDRRVQTHT